MIIQTFVYKNVHEFFKDKKIDAINFEVSPFYLERTYFYRIRRYTIINCWLVSQQNIVITVTQLLKYCLTYNIHTYNTTHTHTFSR